jgi:DNA replication protein DnaC
MRNADPIGAIVRDVEESLRKVVSEDEVRANVAERTRAQRAERLDRYRHAITDDDFGRVIRGELDTLAFSWTERFLAAHQTPRARFLWLTGAVGVGKTVAALWAIAERGGRYVMADDARRAFGQEHDEARALRPRLIDCGLLVVDDVGTARDASEEERALFELLNARQGGRRQTILTGNLSRAEVSERFGGRVISRVFHSGAVVDCGRKNLRRGEKR